MILTAVQRGAYVSVYKDKNTVAFTQPGELVGYTSSSVSIKRNGYIYVYDDMGKMVSSYYTK